MATHEASRVERARRASRLHGVYAIMNEGSGDPSKPARLVLEAGVRILQYRSKQGIVAEHLRAMREATERAGALLIINDDWRAALVFDCDGVHLGPGDDGFDDVGRVRSALGNRLIGLSCGSVEEAQENAGSDIDYIGVGPVFATASKADAGEPLGLSGLREIAQATAFPVAAIGGITGDNLAAVRSSGVAMAAVISAISGASDPRAAASALVRVWNAGST